MSVGISSRYDPYGDSEAANPQIAACEAGRRLARLSWHLQQGWLLGDPAAGNRSSEISKASRRHFSLAKNVCNSLALLAYSIKGSDPDILHRGILDSWREIEEAAFPDGQLDALDLQTQEWLDTGAREETREAFCQELVRAQVTPLQDRLRQRVKAQLIASDHGVLQLGECIEEGLCRPDVCCFLVRTYLWPVLPTEHDRKATADESERMSRLTCGDVSLDGTSDQVLDAPVFPSTLADTSREPGELAPHGLWRRKLKSLWRRVGLSSDSLPESLSCRASTWRRQLTRESLRELVDALFDKTCQHLRASPVGVPVSQEPAQRSAQLFGGSGQTSDSSPPADKKAAAPDIGMTSPGLGGQSEAQLRRAVDSGSPGLECPTTASTGSPPVTTRKKGTWAHTEQSPKGSFPNGPLEGTLKLLAASARMHSETLKKQNGRAVWIMQVHGNRYKMWVGDNATYSEIHTRFHLLSSNATKRDQTR
jgi:hypothetical protein